jgi:hypothetical protein
LQNFILFKIFLSLLCWYIVAFTKVLTTYHS